MILDILGIDPGSEKSAFCLWDGQRVGANGHFTNEEILNLIGTFDGGIVKVACEHMQLMGMPAGKDSWETAYWIGEFRGACRRLNMPFIRLFRGDVKMQLCGSMRAKDPNIRQALLDRIGVQGRKKEPGPTYGIHGHVWSALAIAVTAYDRLAH